MVCPRTCPRFLFLLVAVLAACRDATAPLDRGVVSPVFSQGDDGVWTVTTLDDTPPGDMNCTDESCTLRQALGRAASGDRILFEPGLNGSVQLAHGELEVGTSVSIDGDRRITLDAGGLDRVMIIGPGTTIELVGLTITGGNTFEAGGGIFNRGNLTLRNSTVIGNESDNVGGGIFNSETGTLTLVDCTVDGNLADLNGGGIYNHVMNHLTGSVTIISSTVSGNRAPINEGGGIYNHGEGEFDPGSVIIERSTISGNSADGGGGLSNKGILVIRSSTVTGNGASFNSAIRSVQGHTSVSNSIIAGNYPIQNPDLDDECGGDISSGGHNLVTEIGGCGPTAPTDVIVPAGSVFTDVLKQALADNGGPTLTHALIERGFAIDAGRCIAEVTDQRGAVRPVDEPLVPDAFDGCDIGAYERVASPAPPPPPGADLLLSLGVDKASVKQGELLTYTVRVQNLGPATAQDVVVDNTLSSGVTFVEVRASKGDFMAPPAGETGTVTWSIGDMLDQDNETAELVVTVLVRGKTTITNEAVVRSGLADPNPANNSAKITVTVGGGGPGKGKK